MLEVIEEENLIENAAAVGDHAISLLTALSARYPAISRVRGSGLYLGIELSGGEDFTAPDPELTTAMINGLRDRGVLIGAAGPLRQCAEGPPAALRNQGACGRVRRRHRGCAGDGEIDQYLTRLEIPRKRL